MNKAVLLKLVYNFIFLLWSSCGRSIKKIIPRWEKSGFQSKCTSLYLEAIIIKIFVVV